MLIRCTHSIARIRCKRKSLGKIVVFRDRPMSRTKRLLIVPNIVEIVKNTKRPKNVQKKVGVITMALDS